MLACAPMVLSACGGGDAEAAQETTLVMTDASPRTASASKANAAYPLDFGGKVATAETTTLLSVYEQKRLESMGVKVHSKRCAERKGAGVTSAMLTQWWVVLEVNKVDLDRVKALPGYYEYDAKATSGVLADCESNSV